MICLEESEIGGYVKEMPYKHKFHSGCIEKWLGLNAPDPPSMDSLLAGFFHG